MCIEYEGYKYNNIQDQVHTVNNGRKLNEQSLFKEKSVARVYTVKYVEHAWLCFKRVQLSTLRRYLHG